MWTTIALILLAGTAGCLGEEAGLSSTDTGTVPGDESAAQSGLDLDAQGCTMAGGHSVHPRSVAGAWALADQVPDPWQVADVLEDVGPQVVYSEIPDPMHPVPEEGETWGHYHATITCESWRLDGQQLEDVLLGFVGPKVETPSFAPSSADNEYLATVLATSDPSVHTALQRAGFGTMEADGRLVQHAGQGVEVSMATAHNGEYLSIFDKKELGENHVQDLRLWIQLENVDGTTTPVALELDLEGGTHYGAQGQGYFQHVRTGHHYPLPGAYGHTAAFMLEGFDVSFQVGPQPDVALEDAYDH